MSGKHLEVNRLILVVALCFNAVLLSISADSQSDGYDIRDNPFLPPISSISSPFHSDSVVPQMIENLDSQVLVLRATSSVRLIDDTRISAEELEESTVGSKLLFEVRRIRPYDFLDGLSMGPIWEFVPVVGPIGAMIVEACDNARYKRIKRRHSKGLEIPQDDAIYATYHEAHKNAIENGGAGYRFGRFLKFHLTWLLLLYILAPVLERLLRFIKSHAYKPYNKALPYLKRIGANDSKMPGVTLAAFILGYIDVMIRFASLAYNASSLALMVSLITLSLVVVANRRKNWARIVWTTWVGFGMVCAFGLWAIGELRWPMLAFGSIAMSTALLICLWHPKTCEWFGKSC